MLRGMGFASDSMLIVAPPDPASALPEREDEESYLDDTIELDLLDDPGDDDQESTGLDVGEELDDVLGESVGDNEPIELDLGAFVGTEEHQSDDADERDLGLEVDPAVGLELPDALLPDDGSEGLDHGAIVVDESKFPGLEADDGSEGIDGEREISLGSANDEAKVPLSPVAWRAIKPKAALEACAALSARGQNIVAGSSDLLWFRGDDGAPLRLAIDGSALADLVLLGAAQDVTLAVTRSGQLFRRARFASQAEQILRVREFRAGLGAQSTLRFGGALGSAEARLFLVNQDGVMLEVLEGGDRFEPVELAGKAVALARESATALVAQDRERRLHFFDRQSRLVQPLAGAALQVARKSGVRLATAATSVALAEFGRAIVVSADAGRTFQSVSGTANATALAGAELASGARFFAAVYRETSDRSELLLIDPSTGHAECIAELDGNSEASGALSDPVDRGEWAKVESLCWHPETGRLWAVGGFGVLSFAQPAPT
jgi:hypothetical protein